MPDPEEIAKVVAELRSAVQRLLDLDPLPSSAMTREVRGEPRNGYQVLISIRMHPEPPNPKK